MYKGVISNRAVEARILEQNAEMLRIIAANPDITWAELGKRLGISKDAACNRYRRMQARGLVPPREDKSAVSTPKPKKPDLIRGKVTLPPLPSLAEVDHG